MTRAALGLARLTLASLGLASLALGCGGNDTAEVPQVNVPPRPGALPAPAYADTRAPWDTLAADSLALDSLAVDSLAADTVAAAPAPPSFPRFLSEVQRRVREGASLREVAVGEAARTLAADDVLDPAFREPFLRASPARFRREGTERTLILTVGYDAEGRVVPEDEAVAESSLILGFDLVDGRYRLTRVDLAG